MFYKIITGFAITSTIFALLGIRGCMDAKEKISDLENQLVLTDRKLNTAIEKEKENAKLEESKRRREQGFINIKDKEENKTWLSTFIPSDIDNSIPK